MNGSQPTNGPLQKGPDTEDEDSERAVQKLLDLNFDDWPNDAGVRYLLLRRLLKQYNS
jgi:hypothetical protein